MRWIVIAVTAVLLAGCWGAETAQQKAERLFFEGEFSQSAEVARQLLEKVTDPREKADLHILVGRCHVESAARVQESNPDQWRSELNQAVAQFTAAIELQPTYDEGYHYRKIAYQLLGDQQSAYTDAVKARQFDEDFKSAYANERRNENLEELMARLSQPKEQAPKEDEASRDKSPRRPAAEEDSELADWNRDQETDDPFGDASAARQRTAAGAGSGATSATSRDPTSPSDAAARQRWPGPLGQAAWQPVPAAPDASDERNRTPAGARSSAAAQQFGGLWPAPNGQAGPPLLPHPWGRGELFGSRRSAQSESDKNTESTERSESEPKPPGTDVTRHEPAEDSRTSPRGTPVPDTSPANPVSPYTTNPISPFTTWLPVPTTGLNAQQHLNPTGSVTPTSSGAATASTGPSLPTTGLSPRSQPPASRTQAMGPGLIPDSHWVSGFPLQLGSIVPGLPPTLPYTGALPPERRPRTTAPVTAGLPTTYPSSQPIGPITTGTSQLPTTGVTGRTVP